VNAVNVDYYCKLAGFVLALRDTGSHCLLCLIRILDQR